MPNLDFPGIQKGPAELIAAVSPQNLTDSWADLGDELDVEGAHFIGLFVNLNINDSTNARARLLAKRTGAGTDEYVLSIRTVRASNIKIEDRYVEFNIDADQKMLLVGDLYGLVPFAQFQVQAGAVGSTAGQIVSAYVTTAIGG